MGTSRCNWLGTPAAGILLLVSMTAAGAEAPRKVTRVSSPEINWQKVNSETLKHFCALLRMDTTNPPGHETIAANYLEKVLAAEGVATKVLAHDPARANLVARFKGNGGAKPILILGHTDVVGVQRSKWSVDPFGAVRRNGYIYGRGAMDDKGHVTAGLMVMLLLQRNHVKLNRDVIFLAEAGEEGTTGVGIDFLVSHHWDEIAAEYALAEGGSAIAQSGKVRYVAITTAEKVPRGVRLVAHGSAGHASRPAVDNPVVHLAEAVAKIGRWRTPLHLNETTRAYFDRLAAISSADDADRYRHIGDPARGPEIDRYFERYEPGHYALIRTTVTPTMIEGGFSVNVIPSEAEAYVDVRAMPDEDMPRFLQEMRSLIADPNVEIVPRKPGRPATPPSRIDTMMFRALEHAQRRIFPNAITVPAMLTGATDMAQLRARGVEAYGFGPVAEAGDSGEAHSNDERIAESSLYKLVQFLWYAVLEAAS